MERLAKLDHREFREHLELWDHREIRDQWENKVKKEILEFLVHKDQEVTQEKMEFQDPQELLDLKDPLENVVPLVLLVLEDSKVYLDLLEKMEWQERMAPLVFRVHQE